MIQIKDAIKIVQLAGEILSQKNVFKNALKVLFRCLEIILLLHAFSGVQIQHMVIKLSKFV